MGLLPNEAKRASLLEKAREQLGTVGSGNHYVDVFGDRADGSIWVGVHFGSRGLGHTIASGFLALAANAKWGERVKESDELLDLGTPMGQDYWSLMSLAGEYAYAGRFIGGSMGDDAVIVQGAKNDPDQAKALYSTVHGAGRVMSRTQARGKLKGWGRRARIVSPGLISQEMLDSWIEERGVILRGGGLDEAPQAYRRLPEVLTSQGTTYRSAAYAQAADSRHGRTIGRCDRGTLRGSIEPNGGRHILGNKRDGRPQGTAVAV